MSASKDSERAHYEEMIKALHDISITPTIITHPPKLPSKNKALDGRVLQLEGYIETLLDKIEAQDKRIDKLERNV